VGQDSFIAFYNKLLNIRRITGLRQILFAEAAETAELPDLILPKSYLQLFVKLFFFFTSVIKKF